MSKQFFQHFFVTTFAILFSLLSFSNDSTLIYVFEIKDEIAQPVWRTTKLAMEEAHRLNAKAIFIDMDTYGGRVDMADSIRTKILRSKIPVIIVINNNAASAGALISLACDTIYMLPGSTIGAATVVDQSGKPVPDKYQSYMRSKMRATAEENGRNPEMAEAMVDPDKYIPGIIDSGKVLTFTTSEAIENKFCEGEVNSIQEAIEKAGYAKYTQKKYQPETVDNIIGFLINPAISGVLILIIIGGIYFELQTPGVGFPILASITAAIVFFAPYYLEGLADNWEIILFIVGVILMALEVFVIPGFGIAGISGILCMVAGLTLAMVENVGFDFTWVDGSKFTIAIFTVIIAVSISLAGGVFMLPAIIKRSPVKGIVLNDEQQSGDGFSTNIAAYQDLVGQSAQAYTDLKPSGKIKLENDIYDAAALEGFIEKGTSVTIVKHQGAQVFVRKK